MLTNDIDGVIEEICGVERHVMRHLLGGKERALLGALLKETPSERYGFEEKANFGKLILDLEGKAAECANKKGDLLIRKAKWPKALPFAVALSHDVDQIYDREFYRWMGDVNHLRRHFTQGERCQVRPCIKRILRPIFKPQDPFLQFKRIREIEGQYGWASTFFLLEDDYWRRMGGRFRWDDKRFPLMAQYLLEEHCELGIHGSAYSHACPEWWQAKCSRFERLYGKMPSGARNHYLKLAIPETWRAQAKAGMLYDATFGLPNHLGALGGFSFPFRVPLEKEQSLIELPLTVMDQTLFRYLKLDEETAFQRSCAEIENVIQINGLAVLLWHNNFFCEEEYQEWERVYAALLRWLAPQAPWVATCEAIAKWWNNRIATELTCIKDEQGVTRCEVRPQSQIEELVLEIVGPVQKITLEGDVPMTVLQKSECLTHVRIPSLRYGSVGRLKVKKLLK